MVNLTKTKFAVVESAVAGAFVEVAITVIAEQTVVRLNLAVAVY